jgi:hypothetical protein
MFGPDMFRLRAEPRKEVHVFTLNRHRTGELFAVVDNRMDKSFGATEFEIQMPQLGKMQWKCSRNAKIMLSDKMSRSFRNSELG